MKSLNSRILIPAVTTVIGGLFVFLGLTKFGFWDDINGPMPGFFPTIAGVLLLGISIYSLFQAWGSEAPKYYGIELSVILGCLGIILLTFVIGLIPSVIVYIVVWLRFVEKTPWISTLKVTGFMALLVVGVFVLWLKIPFPMGLIEYLL